MIQKEKVEEQVKTLLEKEKKREQNSYIIYDAPINNFSQTFKLQLEKGNNFYENYYLMNKFITEFEKNKYSIINIEPEVINIHIKIHKDIDMNTLVLTIKHDTILEKGFSINYIKDFNSKMVKYLKEISNTSNIYHKLV